MSDAEPVVEVYVASWNAGFGTLMPHRVVDEALVDRWRTDLVDVGVWRVAVDSGSGRILGFAGTRPSRDPLDPDLGELDTIAVAPDCWRRGVGSVLMRDAIDVMARAGYAEAVLWTLADYPLGQDFYRRTGWSASGEARAEGRQVAFRRRLR